MSTRSLVRQLDSAVARPAVPASFSDAELTGDPDDTGEWGVHPFGGEITGSRTFDGVTIPGAGRVGWLFGTDRWRDGEFFRYEITALDLL